jgi:hypothetical protein
MANDKLNLARRELQTMIHNWSVGNPDADEIYEILGDERGRDLYSIYVTTDRDTGDPVYVMGSTDRWHGDPSLSVVQKKRMSAKENIEAGNYMSFDEIPPYMVKLRSKEEGGLMGRLMKFLGKDEEPILEE